MQRPNMVLRKSVTQDKLQTMQQNLKDLDDWPMWNKFANRILSETHGNLVVNQRIDLHRVVAQQLIEDMWKISQINEGNNPEFYQVVMTWQGQRINGKTSALAIKELTVDITLLHSEEGGLEVTAWWEVTRLSKLLGFGNRMAGKIPKQIFDDLTNYAIEDYNHKNNNTDKLDNR